MENTLKRRIVIVDKPNAPQSALRIGHVGLQRNSPDYAPVLVMNDILGGLFSSRINLNLREAHGYTYGAFSFFQFRRGTGPFVIGSMIRTDVTAPAVKEVFNEVEKIRARAGDAGRAGDGEGVECARADGGFRDHDARRRAPSRTCSSTACRRTTTARCRPRSRE